VRQSLLVDFGVICTSITKRKRSSSLLYVVALNSQCSIVKYFLFKILGGS